jgi:hypothetical protein
MNTIELRKNFHLLIDNLENETLLNNFYDLMKSRYTAKDGQLWNRLTTQEQEELLMTLEESNNPDYLINQDDMKKKHKKWL